jgi:DNA-directed RNA polymerase subunit N (RpoN/RPB10)
MLIPVRCFTCGKTLADKWDWYDEEVKKVQEQKKEEKTEEKKEDKYFDKVKTGEIMDKLGLTRYCCRRHMLGQVDMMKVI